MKRVKPAASQSHRQGHEPRRKNSARLAEHLSEKVARLHLDRIGVKLTKLTKKQADYLGVPIEGPYKPEHYQY